MDKFIVDKSKEMDHQKATFEQSFKVQICNILSWMYFILFHINQGINRDLKKWTISKSALEKKLNVSFIVDAVY